MEKDDLQDLDPSLDVEAEMKRLTEHVDNIIFPGLLERLNKAKVDYNVASSPYTDNYTRNVLAKKYAETMKRTGSVLGSRPTIIREIVIARPKLIVLLEHSAHLAIDWVKLIAQTRVCSDQPNFVLWANTQVMYERQFINEMRFVSEESQKMQVAKSDRGNA